MEKITKDAPSEFEKPEPAGGLPAVIFLKFFALQYLSYFLLTINYRAVAQARYGWTILTDILISAAQFWIIRKVGEAKSKLAWLGFACGGGFGSVTAIWLTKRLFGA